MKVIYSDQIIPSDAAEDFGLFLAGPTPRSPEVKSWRPEALDILSRMKFKGIVYVPEWSNFSRAVDYVAQVKWERTGLMSSARKGKIVVWIPRELKDMPAFTTNVEFGYYLAKFPNAVLYGRPFWAAKCDYLDWLYTNDTSRSPHTQLDHLLGEAITSN